MAKSCSAELFNRAKEERPEEKESTSLFVSAVDPPHEAELLFGSEVEYRYSGERTFHCLSVVAHHVYRLFAMSIAVNVLPF